MATGMTVFFKKELAALKEKTGFNQFENMKLEADWKTKANSLVDHMVKETIRPPFDRIKPEVIQRVLSDAMMNDNDFTGWNPKWVRKALNAWWGVYGGKILEAIDQKPAEVYQKVELDPEADARVNTLLQSFHNSIRNGVFQQVPKISQAEAEELGQERPKAHTYRSTDLSYKKEIDARVRKGREIYFRENYPGATEEQLQQYLDSFEK